METLLSQLLPTTWPLFCHWKGLRSQFCIFQVICLLVSGFVLPMKGTRRRSWNVKGREVISFLFFWVLEQTVPSMVSCSKLPSRELISFCCWIKLIWRGSSKQLHWVLHSEDPFSFLHLHYWSKWCCLLFLS